MMALRLGGPVLVHCDCNSDVSSIISSARIKAHNLQHFKQQPIEMQYFRAAANRNADACCFHHALLESLKL